MVFSGRIDNSNNPLGAGMEVDVLNLNGLLVASPMSVEGLDQIELKPQQLVGVVAIHADVLLGHVLFCGPLRQVDFAVVPLGSCLERQASHHVASRPPAPPWCAR